MRGKITKEILEKMKEDRIAGATYRQIQQKYNVGSWTTNHYLKNIDTNKNFSDTLWKKAEKVGIEYLKKMDLLEL